MIDQELLTIGDIGAGINQLEVKALRLRPKKNLTRCVIRIQNPISENCKLMLRENISYLLRILQFSKNKLEKIVCNMSFLTRNNFLNLIKYFKIGFIRT